MVTANEFRNAGTHRLPDRRPSSKLCAILDSSRLLRMDRSRVDFPSNTPIPRIALSRVQLDLRPFQEIRAAMP